MQLVPAPAGQSATAPAALHFRRPRPDDGPAVWALVRDIRALDDNSLYCNLLQCSHFAETCAIAEDDGGILGWISGYIPPTAPDTLFVWQVAVAAAARGRGLGKRLIHTLLARDDCSAVRRIHSTITADNAASWALFRGIAAELDAPLTSDAHFERDTHFDGAHPTEHLVEIGPFAGAARRLAA